MPGLCESARRRDGGAAGAYPIIPLVGGLVLLHERMARRQARGAALILAGLVLPGTGS